MEREKTFSPTQYITPYLFLIIGNPGVCKVAASERPIFFWFCITIAILGVTSALLRVKRMWTC